MRGNSTHLAPGAAASLLEVFDRIPLEIVSGEGVWLVASDGRRYLDFYGGHAVALLGNGHPRLLAALAKQARTLFFQSNAVSLKVRARAAERLARFAPSGLGRVFFVNSGAEANENALRIAFHATRRERIVAIAGGFHGRTAAAAAVTREHARWYGFPRAPFPVTTVPFDDPEALEREVAADVAAVILEPIQGLAGARPLSVEFLEAARRATRQKGALLIFDEVQCGMGRTGWPFAAQAFGIVPDILTTAKGLAGGFPAGAVLTGEETAGRLEKGALGTTFGGAPLACALIEAVIDVIETEGLMPRVRGLSDRIRKEAAVGPVREVHGIGYLLGLETSRPARDVLCDLRARGILAGGSDDPHTIRLLPPLILEDEHVDRLIETLKEIPE